MWSTLGILFVAQLPGTSEAVFQFGAEEGGINVSLSAEDGEKFVAIEYWDYNNPNESGLMVKTKNNFGNWNGPVVEFPGALTGQGIYPSIMTFPGAANLWVAGITDVGSAPVRGHLQIYKVRRVSPGDIDYVSRSPVTADTTNFTHHVPHLARDSVEPEQHVCWTRKSLTTNAEDAYSEAKSQSDWLSSPGRGLGVTSVVEDHCTMAFDHEGYRYSVFHRANATGGDIMVRIEKHTAGTWTWVGMFPLDGSAGADFPSIWVATRSSAFLGTSSSIHISASDTGGGLLYWECQGDSTSCASAADFGLAEDLSAVTLGLSDTDPKIVAVSGSQGGGAFSTVTKDVFIFYQRVSPPRVRLLSKCASTGTWVDEGTLPVPAAYANIERELHLGVGPAAAKNPVDTYGSDGLHAAYLVENDMGSGGFDVLHYEALGRDFCP